MTKRFTYKHERKLIPEIALTVAIFLSVVLFFRQGHQYKPNAELAFLVGKIALLLFLILLFLRINFEIVEVWIEDDNLIIRKSVFNITYFKKVITKQDIVSCEPKKYSTVENLWNHGGRRTPTERVKVPVLYISYKDTKFSIGEHLDDFDAIELKKHIDTEFQLA